MDLDPVGTPWWYPDAACDGLPARLGRDPWFDGSDNLPEPPAEAAAVCGRCPVRAPCLDYAVRNRIDAGVWGGTTGRQRKQLRTRHAA